MVHDCTILLREEFTPIGFILFIRWLRSLGTSNRREILFDEEGVWAVWIEDYERAGVIGARNMEALEVKFYPRRTPKLTEEFPGADTFAVWYKLENLQRAGHHGIFRELVSEEELLIWQRVDELCHVRELLGFEPAYSVEVTAYDFNEYAYQVVLRLSLQIAQRFNGLIAMGDLSSDFFNEEERKEATQKYLAQYSGCAWALPYWVAQGDERIQHVVDTDFLQDWLSR